MSKFSQRAIVTGCSQFLWGLLTSVDQSEKGEGEKKAKTAQIQDKQ